MTGTESHRVRGVVSSLLASVLFGAMFYLYGVVDASAESQFGWRMIVTVLCYAAALVTMAGRRALGELWTVLKSAWWMTVVLVALSAMVGFQMWLFAWTPGHGYALDASLGYLLLPIALVLIGRLFFRERVSRLQWVAVVIAVVAIAAKIAFTAAVSWVTFAICIGYAVYFMVRRHTQLDLPATFGAEVVILLPVAIPFVLFAPAAMTTGGAIAVIAAGFAGTLAMTAYLTASRLLALPLFGLLTYVEPVLMFVVALLLGERLNALDIVVYGLLAVALTVLAVDGFRASRGSSAVEGPL
ncbi:EamA family transporter RarD [Microbacterium candidum]|uniref:EamA family transporter RarD n=1 Tax=Microbacterium candidum TaxID=3041922 RepID=A0ABT7N016_9MICO|nr:EamA family transporter RarD [Microbacterium sp. ASV49]MDL9980039.1 EamA family transporter RarD [Microbacterium sp. ASV49]